MNQELRITTEQSRERLDIFLCEYLSDRSRSQIQKMIKDGIVTVNGKKVAPHYFLKENDIVVISKIEHRRSNTENSYTPRIITENPHYLVLDKPTGLTVHPTPSSRSSTLVDWLLSHYPAVRKVGDDPLRPGIVHRLDKDASGVMVVALTQDSFESLIRQFKLRQVKKEYLVLVAGRVAPTEGVIDLPIGRSKKEYTKRAAHAKEGRPAITRYEVLEQFKRTALVRVIPETGRTHQIRVHFFAKGNPVIGDTLYKRLSRTPGKAKPGFVEKAERLMLHAERLGFRDRSGAWQEYHVPPPAEFEKIVQEARLA